METAVQKLIDLVQQLAPELWHIGRLSVVTQVAGGFANYLIFTIAMVALYGWLGKSMPVGKVDDMTSDDEDTWIVTFQAYADGSESGQALDVCVDKRTGEITGWNKRPLIIKEGKIESHGLFVTRRIEAE